MSKIWRNFTVHNLFGHPLAEIASWMFGEEGWTFFHDGTLPTHHHQDSNID